MRLFQNYGGFPAYLSQRRQDRKQAVTFKSEITRHLDSRYGAVHLLAPVQKVMTPPSVHMAMYEALQRIWAR